MQGRYSSFHMKLVSNQILKLYLSLKKLFIFLDMDNKWRRQDSGSRIYILFLYISMKDKNKLNKN
jgi:hypothetical protein